MGVIEGMVEADGALTGALETVEGDPREVASERVLNLIETLKAERKEKNPKAAEADEGTRKSDLCADPAPRSILPRVPEEIERMNRLREANFSRDAAERAFIVNARRVVHRGTSLGEAH